MKRDQPFQMYLNPQEKQTLRSVAKRLRRTMGDTVRTLVDEKAHELGLADAHQEAQHASA